VGRKKREHQSEAFIPGSILLTNVTYSHWALAYVLSLRGAQKLLKAEPLAKMIPVDEYIPIMYDQHPNQVWAQAFADRSLKVRKTGDLIENLLKLIELNLRPTLWNRLWCGRIKREVVRCTSATRNGPTSFRMKLGTARHPSH
jgi:hypothetical protein